MMGDEAKIGIRDELRMRVPLSRTSLDTVDVLFLPTSIIYNGHFEI